MSKHLASARRVTTTAAQLAPIPQALGRRKICFPVFFVGAGPTAAAAPDVWLLMRCVALLGGGGALDFSLPHWGSFLPSVKKDLAVKDQIDAEITISVPPSRFLFFFFYSSFLFFFNSPQLEFTVKSSRSIFLLALPL